MMESDPTGYATAAYLVLVWVSGLCTVSLFVYILVNVIDREGL